MKRRADTRAVLAVGSRAGDALRRLGDRVDAGVASNVHEALVDLALDGARPVLLTPGELEPRPRAALRALVDAALPHDVAVLCEAGRRVPPPVARAIEAVGVRRIETPEEFLVTDGLPEPEPADDAFGDRVRPRSPKAQEVPPIPVPPPPARRASRLLDRAALDEVGFADGCFRRLDRPEALCRFVLSRLGRALGARRTSLMLVDEAKTGLFVKAARGMDPSLVGRVRTALSGGLAGRAASLGRVIAGRAAVGGPRAYAGSAYVLLPLGREGRCEGVVSLTEFPDDRVPDDGVLRSMRRMGDRAGLALSAARRIEQAEALSATDELTGLPNRRSFERALRREMERCRRTNAAVAVALLDIDHFKAMNDRFGHPMGDRILVQVARRIAGAFRETDLVCRWGGEEFAVLLPALAEGSPAEALSAIERARAAVAAKPLSLGPGLPCPIATISGGVALYPQHGADAAEVLRRADEALYGAKHAGRDRVLHA